MSDSWEKIAIVVLFAISPFVLYGVYRLFQPEPKHPLGNGDPDVEDESDEVVKRSKTEKSAAKPKREKPRISRSGGLASNVARQEPTFGSLPAEPAADPSATENNAEPIQPGQPEETGHEFEAPSPISAQVAETTAAEIDSTVAAEEPDKIGVDGAPEMENPQPEASEGPEADKHEKETDSEAQGSEDLLDKNKLFPDLDQSKLQYNFFYTVRMRFDESVSTTRILDLTQTLARAATNMFQTTFCYDQQNSIWETPRPGRSYQFLAWSIPLSNRTTHLNKNNVASIVSVIQKAMRSFKGQAEFPPHNDIERRLHLVEEFCDAVDHTVSVGLQAMAKSGGQPQSSGDIVALAENWGMEMIDNQLRKVANGETWFTLVGGSGKDFGSNSPDRKVASLIVSLDFPHVSSPIDAFDAMFEFCGRLARVLRYEIVDGEGKVIEQENISLLREHMLGVRSYMVDRDVTPGSKTARALFN